MSDLDQAHRHRRSRSIGGLLPCWRLSVVGVADLLAVAFGGCVPKLRYATASKVEDAAAASDLSPVHHCSQGRA
ncbi:hypothetical protein MRB53_038912 [Persea americana]|nr:hypothetical protein MRB53_038912 [Persea americana]